MTPERIQELADAEETPKFLFGSDALAEFTRKHRCAHTGECVNPSGWYVVIHPSLKPGEAAFRVLSCWNFGQRVPTSWDVPDGQVETNVMLCDKDTSADLAVFRESRAASPVGETMRKHLKL